MSEGLSVEWRKCSREKSNLSFADFPQGVTRVGNIQYTRNCICVTPPNKEKEKKVEVAPKYVYEDQYRISVLKDNKEVQLNGQISSEGDFDHWIFVQETDDPRVYEVDLINQTIKFSNELKAPATQSSSDDLIKDHHAKLKKEERLFNKFLTRGEAKRIAKYDNSNPANQIKTEGRLIKVKSEKTYSTHRRKLSDGEDANEGDGTFTDDDDVGFDVTEPSYDQTVTSMDNLELFDENLNSITDRGQVTDSSESSEEDDFHGDVNNQRRHTEGNKELGGLGDVVKEILEKEKDDLLMGSLRNDLLDEELHQFSKIDESDIIDEDGGRESFDIDGNVINRSINDGIPSAEMLVNEGGVTSSTPKRQKISTVINGITPTNGQSMTPLRIKGSIERGENIVHTRNTEIPTTVDGIREKLIRCFKSNACILTVKNISENFPGLKKDSKESHMLTQVLKEISEVRGKTIVLKEKYL